MTYHVTHIADPEVRASTLSRLWTSNLHNARDPRAKYGWYYERNPLGVASAFFVANRLPTGEDRAIGCCGVGPRVIWIEGQEHRAGLLADFAVDSSHRTLMPALILQRAVYTHAKTEYALAYAFPSRQALPVLERIGFRSLGPAGRYMRILRYARYVPRVIPVRPLASVVGAVADTGLAMYERARALRFGTRHRLAWQKSPDARFDRLFEDARRRYPLIGDRSAAFLRWRFTERPGLDFDFATLTNAGGDLLAYAVITEKEPGVALLADFLAVSDDALGELIGRMSLEVRARGCYAILAYFLGDPSVGAVLRRQGFAFRDAAKFIVVAPGRALSGDAQALQSVSRWYLTEADRDN